MDLIPGPFGKLSYDDATKVELFRTVHQAFRPWHDHVFMYLCMERAYFWDQVFGRSYENNGQFEAEFNRYMMNKVNGLGGA